MDTIILNNGVKIPCIGNGPGIMGYNNELTGRQNSISYFINRAYNKFYKRKKLEITYINSVANAIRIGFYLLDYSAAYGNEKFIGKAIKKSNVERHELFLTTRVSNKQQLNGNIKEQFFKTLENYQTEYIDLYLFHWPVTDVYLHTWKQMVDLYEQGYCKAVGVANCHQHHLEELLKVSDIVPAVNQIEIHPLFTQKPLIGFCKSEGIVVEAYTPVARFDDRLVRLPLLKNIAKKYNKTIVQIILRWHIQNDVIPIVRSLNKKHQLENISIFDFYLTQEEIKAIDSINIHSRLRYDPDNCDFSIL
jgi:methylglyoxal/glyoxal reductase